eukprot:5755147-Pyramimonas_sp.AAC.1
MRAMCPAVHGARMRVCSGWLPIETSARATLCARGTMDLRRLRSQASPASLKRRCTVRMLTFRAALIIFC